MDQLELSMPLAVPPVAADKQAFYASFAGKILASWLPGAGLNVWLAAGEPFASLHAPMKSAMRFAPTGSLIGDIPITFNMIVLQTWPTAYLSIKEALAAEVPSEIHFENVDAVAVRAAVTPLFAQIGKGAGVVDEFMAGHGLLRISAGTSIGAAAAANGPGGGLTNNVRIVLRSPAGGVSNPVQFFADVADNLAIDKASHPMMSQLDINGWVEIITVDENGVPLASEPYILYLGDGTIRQGNSDANGRIFEQGLPAGNWAVDMPNHPAFLITEQ